MNYGDVIQAWKENFCWIDGRINPYVKKDAVNIFPNPIVKGEIIIRFVIFDNTYFVERQKLTFQREKQFCTSHVNGTPEEREAEAKQLQQELQQFLDDAIADRQKEIDSFRKQGARVLSTNPYAW